MARLFVFFLFFTLLPHSFAQQDLKNLPGKTHTTLATVQDNGADKQKEPSVALILATFGTTYTQQGDTLALVKQEMAKRHPDLPQFVAYTSAHVAKTLRAQGHPAKNLVQTMADLSAEGYSHVVVQSLHVTAGKEFAMLSDTAQRFQHLPKGITATYVGQPLLGSHADAQRLAVLLAASLPEQRTKEDAVVFVGHGTESFAGSLAYPALQAFLWENDPLLFVGTIEGPYDLQSTLATLQARQVKNVWLVPLMTVVGDHAKNDIFGKDDASWITALTQAGFTPTIVSRGLLALPQVASLWADHADAALEQAGIPALAGSK